MKKMLKDLSLYVVLLLIFLVLLPFSALAEETLTPSLSVNSEEKYTVSSVEDLNTLRSDTDELFKADNTDQVVYTVIAQIEGNIDSQDITNKINGLQTWIKNYVKSVFDQT